MPLKPEQLSYDLRIGVTGHRNLSQEKAVSEAVDRLVAYIDKMISHNENLPIEWVVISPLAKGADRIVARSILKKENAHLKVIMPFPIDEYRNDFTDPKDLQEFDALLGSPHILVKPLVFNTSSGYTHIEFSAVKQDSCSVTFEVMKPSC